ncbi:hypothetical protein Btru_036497 [Bulinus truncatus]|nr:hypothetical protein Btru_036497 [Bulinus truncatus]
MFTSVRTKHKLSNRRFIKTGNSGYESSRSTSRDSVTDNSVKCSTPYRLPRLLHGSDEPMDTDADIKDIERVYGRFGFEYIVRLPELKPLTPSEFISPQRLLSQRYRQVSLVPRLRTSEMSPVYRHTPSIDRESDSDSFQQSDSPREPTETARSNSVQWKLGQINNCAFDVTGQSHVQGPYSRGFTVRCRAPPSWMKMKWGRKTTKFDKLLLLQFW